MKATETIGSLIDRLFTIDTKMWWNQEMIYEIRRLSLDEFKSKYSTPEGLQKLYECLKKACDLNVQRNQLIDAIDEHFSETLNNVANGIVDENYVQKKHKTY